MKHTKQKRKLTKNTIQIGLDLRILGNDATIPNMYMYVDGTDCAIQQPEPFSTEWYTQKQNVPGLRYEVAVSICIRDTVWVSGPYVCGIHPDLRVYREVLKSRLLRRNKLIRYNGYLDPTMLLHSGAVEFQQLHIAIRAQHKMVNGRWKRLNVLCVPFRHRHELHGICFYEFVKIAVFSMTFEKPLFALPRG